MQDQLPPFEQAKKQLFENLERNPSGYGMLWAQGDGRGMYTVYGYYRDSWLKEWRNDVIGTKLNREEVIALGVLDNLIQ